MPETVKNFVLLRLRGGLGNQLFQYAAARSLAVRNGVPLVLNTTSGFSGDKYGRHFELEAFNIVYDQCEESLSTEESLFSKCRLKYWRVREYVQTRYMGRSFDPAIYHQGVRRPLIFESYSQSYLYFADIEDLIRRELTIKDSRLVVDQHLADDIAESNSVCLHVRRLQGLFANGVSHKSVGDYYGQCDLEYYRRSLDELVALYGNLRVFLFSDDIVWAQENAPRLETGKRKMHVVDEPDSLRCFILMSRCKHFVIANSTYSWWAAWLGTHSQKTIFAPSVWNRGDWRSPRDLYPRDWKIVPVS